MVMVSWYPGLCPDDFPMQRRVSSNGGHSNQKQQQNKTNNIFNNNNNYHGNNITKPELNKNWGFILKFFIQCSIRHKMPVFFRKLILMRGEWCAVTLVWRGKRPSTNITAAVTVRSDLDYTLFCVKIRQISGKSWTLPIKRGGHLCAALPALWPGHLHRQVVVTWGKVMMWGLYPGSDITMLPISGLTLSHWQPRLCPDQWCRAALAPDNHNQASHHSSNGPPGTNLTHLNSVGSFLQEKSVAASGFPEFYDCNNVCTPRSVRRIQFAKFESFLTHFICQLNSLRFNKEQDWALSPWVLAVSGQYPMCSPGWVTCLYPLS